jgi:hypothetical protein
MVFEGPWSAARGGILLPRNLFSIFQFALREYINLSFPVSICETDLWNFQDKAWLYGLGALDLEIWLGGLDSNQDNQIQNLRSYRLNDLPAG